jgi:hypothetical protein
MFIPVGDKKNGLSHKSFCIQYGIPPIFIASASTLQNHICNKLIPSDNH